MCLEKNVGCCDSKFRITVAFVIAAVGAYYHSWWGLISLIPFITGMTRVCPLYMPFKFSTIGMCKCECETKPKKKK